MKNDTNKNMTVIKNDTNKNMTVIKNDTNKNMTVINSAAGDTVENLMAELSSVAEILKQQSSPFDTALVLAGVQCNYRGWLKHLGQKTNRPYPTLSELYRIGDQLRPYAPRISGTALAWQTRCLGKLAHLHKQSPDKALVLLNIILDNQCPQNTVEAAIAKHEFDSIANDDAPPGQKTLDQDTIEDEALRLVAEDEQVSSVQRMAGQYLRLSQTEQLSFLEWLDEYLETQRQASQ